MGKKKIEIESWKAETELMNSEILHKLKRLEAHKVDRKEWERFREYMNNLERSNDSEIAKLVDRLNKLESSTVCEEWQHSDSITEKHNYDPSDVVKKRLSDTLEYAERWMKEANKAVAGVLSAINESDALRGPTIPEQISDLQRQINALFEIVIKQK